MNRLPPEVTIDLQIHLDRLVTLQERCRAGIRDLANGVMTVEAYRDLLSRAADAQHAWEASHRQVFKQ